jgi:hypothetical protein
MERKATTPKPMDESGSAPCPDHGMCETQFAWFHGLLIASAWLSNKFKNVRKSRMARQIKGSRVTERTPESRRITGKASELLEYAVRPRP